MNEAQETPAPAPNTTPGDIGGVAPGKNKTLFLVLGLVVLLPTIWFGWNRARTRHKLPIPTGFAALIPAPSFTASPSAGLSQTATESHPPEILGQVTTKGGLPLQTATPVLSPSSVQVKSVTQPQAAAANPSIWLTKVYLDAQFPYRISFNDNWIFRHNHGANAAGSEEGILSQVDLSRNSLNHPSAYVSAGVYSGHGLSNINDWVKNYDRTNSDTSVAQKLTFAGVMAVNFVLSEQSQKLYFLKGAYVYRLDAWQNGYLSAETLAIRDSFQP